MQIQSCFRHFAVLCFVATVVFAVDPLPTGADVVHGNVSIGIDANAMNISQTTHSAIVNWESFSIGAGYSVLINQPSPSSAMLSRVVGANPSEIFGALQANGALYLVNPNGIIFGPNAVVDVAKLVASTLDIHDTDFINGDLNFVGPSDAEIVNYGTITAQTTILLANQIANDGAITANHVGLGACGGNAVLTDDANGGAVTFDFSDVAAPEALVTHSGNLSPSPTPNPNSSLTISSTGDIAIANDISGFGSFRLDAREDITATGTITDIGTFSATAGNNIELNTLEAENANINAEGCVFIADITDSGNTGINADIITPTSDVTLLNPGIDNITGSITVATGDVNTDTGDLVGADATDSANSAVGPDVDAIIESAGGAFQANDLYVASHNINTVIGPLARQLTATRHETGQRLRNTKQPAPGRQAVTATPPVPFSHLPRDFNVNLDL